MTKLIAIVTHRYVLWGLLSLPALRMLFSIVAEGHVPSQFQTGSGEWAMRFLLLTLALTPLQRLFRKSRFVHAFMRRRRDIGLASFFYALLHVGFFLFETFLSWGPGAWTWLLFSATSTYALAGWLALGLFVPLALTSNGLSQRWLGRHWKTLQRATYVAALAAALHWLLQANTWQTWLQLSLVISLEAVRLVLFIREKQRAAAGDRAGWLG